MPGDPGEAICRPYSGELGAIDLDQLDVDDHLGPRLVDGGDHARGGGDALGRVLDRQRVGGGRRRDAPRVEHHAQQIHRLLEIGVAQIERPDDLFLVLAALGRRVRDDDDRLRRGDAEERARRAGDRGERVVERRVAQIDGDRRVAERRVEDQADVGEPRDGGEDVAAAGVAEDERRRHLHAGRQIHARRRQIARALDQRLQLGLAFARRRRPWRAACCAWRAAPRRCRRCDGFSSAATSYSTSA